MFKGVPPVSINVRNEKWGTVLTKVLEPHGFVYVVKDGIVVVRKQQTEKSDNRIRGTVVDSNKEPIPGASIIVKRELARVLLPILRVNFTLDVESDKVALEVSFIGMKNADDSSGCYA